MPQIAAAKSVANFCNLCEALIISTVSDLMTLNLTLAEEVNCLTFDFHLHL